MTVVEIRRKLADNQATIGSWLQLPSTDVAELMAGCGYDWIAVDMEHGSFGLDILPDIFRAIECGGSCPFARLPEASRVWIKFALEAGARGLIFPMVESLEQLNNAVNLSTYPGQDFWQKGGNISGDYRGVGFCRANGFGKYFAEYRAEMERGIFLAAQIEHIRAVNALDAILSHKRLDAIMVGPYDLSGSMGITGQFDNPLFIQVMDQIKLSCRKHGVRMGVHIVQPDADALMREIAAGCQFIAYGIDSVFLWHAAQRPELKRS